MRESKQQNGGNGMIDDETMETFMMASAMMRAIHGCKDVRRGKDYHIDCPVCKTPRALYFGYAEKNGHIHANCPVCKVSIMQ